MAEMPVQVQILMFLINEMQSKKDCFYLLGLYVLRGLKKCGIISI